jgi:putative sugar O-methyltransferase
MFFYPDLDKVLAAMENAPEVYRPSVFWKGPSAAIADQLKEHGIEKFRSLAAALMYFVPTWGAALNGFSPEMVAAVLESQKNIAPNATKPAQALAQFFSGELAAQADYRVLCAGDRQNVKPNLHTFTESEFGMPVGQMSFEGRRFSRSSMNYLLGLALLKKHLAADAPRVVLEVGGGFGTMGEIYNSSGVSNWKYIDIDIPPTSFVAQWYLEQILGKKNVAGWADTHSKPELKIDDMPQASVLATWQIEQLRGTVDLFVNFISFQEMEPAIVQNYLNHADRLKSKWVLLRNIREGKQKVTEGRTDGVKVPVVGDDYAKMLPQYDLIERATLPFGHKTVDNFHSELQLFRRC